MPLDSTTCALILVESQAARVMHAFCAFMRGAYCGGKQTDVARRNERPIMYGTHTQRRNSADDEELAHCDTRNCFPGKTVLASGNPSRNVIEKILRSKTTNTAKYSVNIKQVLKLNNSKETLENFEKFRDDVKNRAYDHHNKHPRNIVDGNEKLMFYGTKLAQCQKFGTSKLYADSICSIIKPGFYEQKMKTGIWLTTDIQDVIVANANAEMRRGEMAIAICRVISGKIMNDSDEDEYDSVRGVKPNYLFVKDPSAVLPCFVIILKCRYFH
ncbi:hypothetical protein SSX86_005934 [Deinandra increscens subsp. villosa]|uniref:Uncharacterized protein n=1 Tax=Deinandra increscens subsp. villosa TaxID=3103831 RepID=A0AAP0DRY0_9ASTR